MKVEDPVQFFSSRGRLHDALVRHVRWQPRERLLALAIEDINANFEGLAEYVGKRPAELLFRGVDDLQMNCDVQSGDIQRVYGMELSGRDQPVGHIVRVMLSPSGSILFECREVEVNGAID